MAPVKQEIEDVAAVQRERLFRRKWLLGFAAIFLFGFLGWAAHKAYPRWQERHLAALAQRFFERGEYRDAFLAAQRTLEVKNTNVVSTRLMAQIFDKANLYESIAWWKRLAVLNPGDPEDAISLAAAALRYQEVATAEKALKSVGATQRNSAAYHSMAASVALALNHKEDALAHYAEALKLAPGNEQCKLDLAAAQLQFSDPATQAKARAEVETLRASKKMRLPALRLLVNDANKRTDDHTALALSRELAADPSASFQDQILRLSTLYRVRDRDFASHLATLQQRAPSDLQDLYMLLTWMNEHNHSLAAVEWWRRLPAADHSSNPHIAAALAQAYAKIGDWANLRSLVADSKWENLEFLRLAYLARVLREQGDAIGSKNQWNLAMRAASARDVSVLTLEKLVASWGWEEETEEALWASANGGLNPVEALEKLVRKYHAKSDTRSLLRAFQLWHEVDPSRLDVKNNVAMLSLLLRVNLIDAYVKAWELYSTNPRAPIFASTFAYSLHLQGFDKDALKVLASLGNDALHDPSVAAYCAILLVAQGALDQARPFLEIARDASLLPEEKVLLYDAREKVEVHESTKQHSF